MMPPGLERRSRRRLVPILEFITAGILYSSTCPTRSEAPTYFEMAAERPFCPFLYRPRLTLKNAHFDGMAKVSSQSPNERHRMNLAVERTGWASFSCMVTFVSGGGIFRTFHNSRGT